MRYMARRITTGEWITRDLALREVESTTVLSGPGSITGTVEAEFNREVFRDGLRQAEDWATMIYAVNDNDEIVNHGIVQPPTSYDASTQIQCAGVASYPRGYIYTGRKLWGPQLDAPRVVDDEGLVISERTYYLPYPDPVALFHEHWAWIQTQPYSNLGVQTTGARNTGTRIGGQLARPEPQVGIGTYEDPYRLADYETPDLGNEIDRLVEAAPFDYQEKVVWIGAGGDTPLHQIEVGYPRLGRRRYDLRFAQGENVALTPTIQTLPGSVNWLIGIGNGDAGPDMVFDTFGWADGRLRRPRILTDKTLDKPTMHSRLMREQDTLSRQRFDVTSVAIIEHENAPLSQIQLGDDIRVLADHPEYGEVDIWVRVLAVTKGDYDEVAVLTTSASVFFSYKPSEEFP